VFRFFDGSWQPVPKHVELVIEMWVVETEGWQETQSAAPVGCGVPMKGAG
jgi:hypothetical protein